MVWDPPFSIVFIVLSFVRPFRQSMQLLILTTMKGVKNKKSKNFLIVYTAPAKLLQILGGLSQRKLQVRNDCMLVLIALYL